MKRILFGVLIAVWTAVVYADHVYFPEWQIPKVAPEKLNDWDLSKAFRKQGGERTDISLNGFWKFALCEKEQETPAAVFRGVGIFPRAEFLADGADVQFLPHRGRPGGG